MSTTCAAQDDREGEARCRQSRGPGRAPPGHPHTEHAGGAHPARPASIAQACTRAGKEEDRAGRCPRMKPGPSGLTLCRLTDRRGSELQTVSKAMGILEVTREYQKRTKFSNSGGSKIIKLSFLKGLDLSSCC